MRAAHSAGGGPGFHSCLLLPCNRAIVPEEQHDEPEPSLRRGVDRERYFCTEVSGELRSRHLPRGQRAARRREGTMRRLGAVIAVACLVGVLPAQDGIQRGKIKKLDLDKQTITITSEGKDLDLLLHEETRVLGSSGQTLAERFRGV